VLYPLKLFYSSIVRLLKQENIPQLWEGYLDVIVALKVVVLSTKLIKEMKDHMFH